MNGIIVTIYAVDEKVHRDYIHVGLVESFLLEFLHIEGPDYHHAREVDQARMILKHDSAIAINRR